jgi:hypothetical protein
MRRRKRSSMAREEFIDNLWHASRLLPPPRVSSGQGAKLDDFLGTAIHSADLWLTPKAVEGFDRDDFAAWPSKDQEKLAKEVTAFLDLARGISPNEPAPKAKSSRARKHLEAIIEIVGHRLLNEWLEAQERMVEEAMAAARERGWYVEKGEKKLRESLLGAYSAPRLRIRTPLKEVVLDPIACFGSGREGVVDLVVMPTYETAYYVILKEGRWHIVSSEGTLNRRPFNRRTLVNTINKVPDR